jgi:hypothetical protein
MPSSQSLRHLPEAPELPELLLTPSQALRPRAALLAKLVAVLEERPAQT